MGAPAPNSKVQFYPGQKEVAGRLFEPGGIFDQILAGGPNIRTEQAASRGQEQMSREFAARGLEGSPLEARALSDSTFKANIARENAQVEQLLTLIQPAGTKSSTTGVLATEFGGLFTK